MPIELIMGRLQCWWVIMPVPRTLMLINDYFAAMEEVPEAAGIL